MLSDREERCPQALVCKRLEYCLGIVEPGAVVESEHDLMVAQEVISLEMLGTKARPSRSVDLDHT